MYFSVNVKQGEKLNLLELLVRGVESQAGPQVATQAREPLAKLQTLRQDLLQIAQNRNDVVALERLLAASKTYVGMWAVISESFIFGNDQALTALTISRRTTSRHDSSGETVKPTAA